MIHNLGLRLQICELCRFLLWRRGVWNVCLCSGWKKQCKKIHPKRENYIWVEEMGQENPPKAPKLHLGGRNSAKAQGPVIYLREQIAV